LLHLVGGIDHLVAGAVHAKEVHDAVVHAVAQAKRRRQAKFPGSPGARQATS